MNERGTRLRRFKPYSAYKDSGAEWLREIPAHWEVTRSKALFGLRNVRALADESQLTASQQYGVIPQSDFMAREGRRVVQVITGAEILRHVEAKDFVISMRSFQGGIEWSPFSGAISSAYVVLAPSERVWHPFFVHLFKSRRYIQALQSTSDLVRDGQALRFENFVQVPLPVVPSQEQRAIAAFLDRETARIDALVVKKERLIELLQEKRTALITRAVAKGLDPTVPMKDSGVEWLGEIPAHWDVKRVKQVTSKIGSGKTPSGGAEVYVSEGVMLIRSQNVHFGGLVLDDVAYIDSETDAQMAGSRVQDGDVLLNITGASLGRCCVARLDGKRANVNQHVCVIRPKAAAYVSEFLAAAIASHSGQAQVFTTENGISRDALNFEQIGELVVAQPPLEEQRAIVSRFEGHAARIDALVAKVREAIVRLKELRTALISAAVTGKIDVREEAA